ncbi:hypothetical protein LXJ58_34675, partial [Escherichia coli]|nr:hypothetical protein [Escherichia coli]
GAFPGVQAEERGQAEAIARSTEACLAAGVPVVALVRRRSVGRAARSRSPQADVSTGQFMVIDVAADALGAELARLGAAEVVASEGSGHADAATSLRPRQTFDSGAAEARLKALFGVATLDGFGQFGRAALAAAGGLVAYLDHTAKGTLPFLRPPQL